MRLTDIIFALVIGKAVGYLIHDFLKEWGIVVGVYYTLVLWIVFPFLALFCLWWAYRIGKKALVIFQVAKFLLVGAFAMVVDLQIFELSIWLFGLFLWPSYLLPKSISFLIATAIKYWGNKYWVFLRHEKENLVEEAMQFFLVTLIGLAIDVVAFYYFVKVLGPQFSIPEIVWVKLSVIFAAIVSALFNFLGYKFVVFKK